MCVRRPLRGLGWTVAAAMVAGGCYVGVDGAEEQDPDAAEGDGEDAAGDPTREPNDGGEGDDAGSERVAEIGLRRLTSYEYAQTVRALVHDETAVEAQLVDDSRDPFDNAYEFQNVSPTLIDTAEHLANQVAADLVADPDRMAAVVGCDPEPDAQPCLEDFVRRFGRLAFRRSLTAEEIDHFGAVNASDFPTAVQTLVSAFLQHPAFLYRIEVGTPIPGHPDRVALTGPEIATRLSYLLWGSGPDAALLDVAESGGLSGPDQVRDVAAMMIEDPRSERQIARYHAMWLGYDALSHDLSEAMIRESDALVARVVFEERRPWSELFTWPESFVDAALADNYGMPRPAGPGAGWVRYPDDDQGRAGILSHGTFLALGVSEGVTRPTARGRAIRRRLFCSEIELPTEEQAMDADVDAEPPEEACIRDWYEQSHASGGCRGCHSQLDPIGFGLQNFDRFGRYQLTEPGKPHCEISGEGNFEPLGAFRGPGELGALLAGSPEFDRCMVDTLYRFVIGRAELTFDDVKLVSELAGAIDPAHDSLLEALITVVGHPTFSQRRLPDPAEEGRP